MSKYIITRIYCEDIIFETDDRELAIKKLKELEQKDYDKYLDYSQRCIDNYEPYAEYIPEYFIEYKNKYYNINNYFNIDEG